MDKRYLERRRQGWYAVRDVPAKLVPLIGRKRLRVSLKTRDLRVAQHRRWAALERINQQIAKEMARADHSGLLAEALEIRQTLDDPAIVARWGSAEDGDLEELTAADFADEIVGDFIAAARRRGHPDPGLLAKIALGEATPIQTILDAWLAEQDIEARSKGDHRRAIAELIGWANAANVPPSVEAFTRKVAGRYVTALLSRKVARATIGKRLWSLSALWRWLCAKGHAEENPWTGHGVSQAGKSERDKERERPFTDAEMVKLLGGTKNRTLRDMMRLAALSGMREEEIALLQARDVDLEERTMSVRESPKTPAARRVVPIHPDMLGCIRARVAGRPPDAFVIAELGPAPKEGRQRSMAFAKRFGRYRVTVGVHEKREGQRRSLVNFHSFRRWFITKAEQAGQPENIIRSVAGHKRPGVTLGVYSGGASLQQRRACVEAVRLPAPREHCDASERKPSEVACAQTAHSAQKDSFAAQTEGVVGNAQQLGTRGSAGNRNRLAREGGR